MNRSLILLAIFFLACQSQHAIQRSREIIFRTSTVDTRSSPLFHQDAAHTDRVSRHSSSQLHQYLLHVGHPLSQTERSAIEDYIGTNLGQYFPHNTYLLFTTERVARIAANAPGVLWIGALSAEHKISEEIKADEDRLDVMLAPIAWPTESVRELAQEWEDSLPASAQCVASTDRIRVTLSTKSKARTASVIQWLADRPEVHFIEAAPVYQSYNLYAAATIETNGVSQSGASTTPYSTIFNGAGTKIGLADSGIRTDSCSFTGVTITYNSTYGDNTDGSGHGTSVAGTIAGRSATGVSAGILTGASLYFNDIQTGTGAMTPPTPISNMFAAPYGQGVRVYAMPFGSKGAYYGADAVSIDQFMASYPKFLVVTASGNNDLPTGDRSLSTLGQSKNALVVGGCHSIYEGATQGLNSFAVADFYDRHRSLFGSQVLSSFSSRGPTADGRLKPDVVAPSLLINSTSNSAQCASALFKGTSYATGVATAAAAMARAYLVAGYDTGNGVADPAGDNQDPSAALIKAMLINGAEGLLTTDINGNSTFQSVPRPSGLQGFGRINLINNLYTRPFSTVSQQILLSDLNSIGQGETQNAIYLNTTAASMLTVTLVWTDLPGSPASGHILVNDLDVVVIDQSGLEYRTITAGGAFDSTNNVEQIELTVPMYTALNILVYGRVIPGNGAKQPYALVVSGAFTSIPSTSFQPSNLARPRICPNGCSGRGTCTGTGTCTCNTGSSGVDCSLSPCPSATSAPCSGNGYCDASTGSCVCGLEFAQPNCNVILPPVTPPVSQNATVIVNNPSPQEISKGLLAGAVIAAFIIGGVIFLIVGLCLAVRYLEHKRDKAMAARAAADEEMN